MKDREGGVGASLVITEPAFFEHVDDMASPSRREGSARKRAAVSACFGEVRLEFHCSGTGQPVRRTSDSACKYSARERNTREKEKMRNMEHTKKH